MKAVDVDTLLAETKLKLTLGGKTYEIEDVPLPVFLKTAIEEAGEEQDREVLHKQLAEILGVDKSELKDVGLKAATLAVHTIREWILDVEGISKATPDKGGTKTNP